MTQKVQEKILEKLNHLEKDLSFIKWYIIINSPQSLPQKSKGDSDISDETFPEVKALWEKEWEKEWTELGII